MINAITSALSSVLTWAGTVVTSIIDSDSGSLYALLPLFAVGIAISVVFLGVKVIKSLVWGS